MPLTLDDLKQRDMTATALRKDSDMDYLDIEDLKEKAELVKVKPLEWAEMPEKPVQYKGFLLSKIKTVNSLVEYGITYVAQGELDRLGKPWTETRAGYPRYELDAPFGGSGNFSTLEDAKAAAQADHEQRMLSALDLSELSRLRSENEGMRKALSKIDWRGLFMATHKRMMVSGESKEMGARWFAGDADAAINAALSPKKEDAR